MNRYASGYTLISLISVIGWLAIVLSVVGGIIIGVNAPRGAGYIGFTLAIAGSFQGLLLLGVGAIGQAVLDGSIAQQSAAASLEALSRVNGVSAPQEYRPQFNTPEVDFSKIQPMKSLEEIEGKRG